MMSLLKKVTVISIAALSMAYAGKDSSQSWEYREGVKTAQRCVEYIIQNLGSPFARAFYDKQWYKNSAHYLSQLPSDKERLLFIEGFNEYCGTLDYKIIEQEHNLVRPTCVIFLSYLYVLVNTPIHTKLLACEVFASKPQTGERRYTYKDHPRYEEFKEALSHLVDVFIEGSEKGILELYGPESEEYKSVVQERGLNGCGELFELSIRSMLENDEN